MYNFLTKRLKYNYFNLLKHYQIKYYKCNCLIKFLSKANNQQLTKNYSKMHNFIQIFIIIFLMICYSNLFVTATKQLIVEHPKNTIARIGDTVILKCRVENQVTIIIFLYN